MCRPDFSPATLKLFLNGRIEREVMERDCNRDLALTAVRKIFKRETKMLLCDFDAALRGRLLDGRKRAAIWGWLGHVPAESGFALHDDGTQERVGQR